MIDVRDEAVGTAPANDRGTDRGSFIWYELMTTDAEGAKAFYDEVVGWNIGEASPDFNGYRMIGRSDGKAAGGVLPLTSEMQQHGARPTWLGYIHVTDVDRAVGSIEQAGGKSMMPAFDIPNVGRIAMVTDPQGAAFYLMKPTPPADDSHGQSDVFSVDQPQRVRWNELATADPGAAIEFYKEQFGWAQEGDMDMGPLGKYSFLQHDGNGIGAVMRKPDQMPVSMWTYYIGVDDIDRAANAIRDGGGQILNGPMEIPGGEYALHGMDPQGAPFGLVGPRCS